MRLLCESKDCIIVLSDHSLDSPIQRADGMQELSVVNGVVLNAVVHIGYFRGIVLSGLFQAEQ